MASGQAKHGKEKTKVRREWTGQVFHFFAMSSGEICAVKSYSLDSFLPEKQNCHPICCGISKLSVLCLCLVFFFPVLLFADHCRLCPSSPACHHCLLVPSPHSLLHPQSDPPWQSFTPAFLRFRSSQNIDKTQMVRSTAASDRASSRTPTHHGRSQLQLHTRGSWHGAGSVLALCWELLRRDAEVGLLRLSALCPAATSHVLDLLDALPGHSVLACFNPPCFSTCCSAAPTNASSVALSEASPTHVTNQTGKSHPSRREMLGQC